MVMTCDVTACTAAGDKTETSIGSITLPSNCTRVYGFGVNQGGPGVTDAEGTAGMFRISINSLDITPSKYPVDGSLIETTACYQAGLRIWEADWTKNLANATVSFWVTMDETQTAANTFRGFVIFEKG